MVEVTDVPEARHYVVTVDGAVAGRLDYRLDGDLFVAVHTEVDPAFAGQGLGGRLVRRMLADVRDAGLRLRPSCPFVRRYVETHPDYADLVADEGVGG